MRLWSLHPHHLDPRGLIACWRESLLAKKVLDGKTDGYKNHPQLRRFRAYSSPLTAINTYLWTLHQESLERSYKFDESKIDMEFVRYGRIMTVNDKQLDFEMDHLTQKVRERSPDNVWRCSYPITPNPMFQIKHGPIEKWEKDKKVLDISKNS